MTTRILVVEDHPSMREALVAYVSSLPNVEVCGTAADAEDALTELARASVDIVLIDISLPGMSGLDLLREVKARWHWIHCLILTGHDAAAYRAEAFSRGAYGYVSKGNAEDLGVAIRAARDGK